MATLPVVRERANSADVLRRPKEQATRAAACNRFHRSRRNRLERESLILQLLPLVKRMAQQMRGHLPLHIELDDLVSTGTVGLVDAVRKFDPRRHVKLESYARHRIRGAILDGLREVDPASRDLRKKNKRAERTYARLESKLERAPTDQEMAEALGVSLPGWYETVRELQTVGVDWLRPLGRVSGRETAEADWESLPADSGFDQFERCYRREQREILDSALGRIPERERQVVLLYYDLNLTMKQIAAKLRIDESRVSQLHAAALARLRARIQTLIRRPRPKPVRFAA
jgi:RNA polymerase sigma factor for flagellar operon FliA